MFFIYAFLCVMSLDAVSLCSYIGTEGKKFQYNGINYIFGENGCAYREGASQHFPFFFVEEPAYVYSKIAVPRENAVLVLSGLTVNKAEMLRITKKTVKYIKKQAQKRNLSVWIIARGGFYFEQALQEEELSYKNVIISSASFDHEKRPLCVAGFDQEEEADTICILDDVLDNGITTAVALLQLRERYPHKKFMLAFCWLKQGRAEKQVAYTTQGKNAFQRVAHALVEQKYIMKIGVQEFRKQLEDDKIDFEEELSKEEQWLKEHVVDTYAHMTLQEISVPADNIDSLEGWIIFTHFGANFFTKIQSDVLNDMVFQGIPKGRMVLFLFKDHTGRSPQDYAKKEVLLKISHYVEEMGIPYTYGLLREDGKVIYRNHIADDQSVILFSEVPAEHPVVANIAYTHIYTDFGTDKKDKKTLTLILFSEDDADHKVIAKIPNTHIYTDLVNRKYQKLLKPLHIAETMKLLPTRTLDYTSGPIF